MKGCEKHEWHGALRKGNWAASPTHIPGLQSHTLGPQGHPWEPSLPQILLPDPAFCPWGSWVPGPFTCLSPGWCWDGVGREGGWVLTGSWAHRAVGLAPSPRPSSPSQLAPKGKRGGGNFTGKLLFFAQNRHRLGTELPLGCHGDRGHLSSCLFSQCGFHGDNRP